MHAAALRVRRRLPLDWQGQSLALWGGWLLAALLYFSFSRFYHLYYLSLLAPAVAALAGLGAVVLWRAYRATGWQGWALPLALLATAALQAHLLSAYPDWSAWLTPLVLGATLLTALRLYRAHRRASDVAPRVSLPVALAAALLALLALFVAPATWTAISLADGNGAAWLPQAGPGQGPGRSRPGSRLWRRSRPLHRRRTRWRSLRRWGRGRALRHRESLLGW